MSAPWNAVAIGEAFVEAAIDPDRWPAALGMLSDATGAHGASLVPVDRKHRERFAVTPSLEEVRDTYIRQNWKMRDERDAALPLLSRRRVITDLDVTDFDQVKRSPYYQEFLAPNHLAWFAGLSFGAGADGWCICIQRSVRQDPFAPHEIDMLTALSPRIESAAALVRALDFARADTAAQAFELSGHAVIMLDRSGTVVRVNAVAEGLISDGFEVRAGQIVAHSPLAQAAFDSALSDLLARPLSTPLTAPVAFPRAGRHPLLAYAIRLSNSARDIIGGFQVAVVILDPLRRPMTSRVALEIAFGLSRSEARLAARLAEGASLKQIANDLGIAYETARAQLKSIFIKTRVNRQAELVALLGRMSPQAQ